MNKRLLSLLSTSHMVNDFHQGALPALLPFLILQHDISYSAAAFVVLAFTATATVIQPLAGILVDRYSRVWLISCGILLTSFGFALVGFVPSYSLLLAAVVISGFGSAIFHPGAAKLVNFAGGWKKATGMSLFGVGGLVGFSAGPFIITTAVLAFGMKGLMITLVPAVAMAFFLWSSSSSLQGLQKKIVPSTKDNTSVANADDWRSFSILSLTIIGKSVIYYALFTFIPLYWTSVLGQSQMSGAAALTIFSIAGVVGNIGGGYLADRYGYTTIIRIGCTLLVPSLPILLWVDNVFLAGCMVCIVGALLLSTYGPTIILGQKYLPHHMGFASGMTLGVAFSIGGVVTPLIGYLADNHGLPIALTSVIGIPIIITALAYALPAVADDDIISSSQTINEGELL